ncbi:MAG: S41 family peptidase [Erysipelotrichales bacterium]
MKKHRKIILGIIVLIIYSFGLVKITNSAPVASGFKTNDQELSRFIENYNYLKENWVFFKDEKTVINAATDAMSNSAGDNDHYTGYIPADQQAEYFSALESEFVGIGVQYMKGSQYPIVSNVFVNAPADKAGIKTGDSIVSANGKSLKGLEQDKVKKAISGEDGTSVKLELLRNNKKVNVSVKREKIEASVHYQKMDNKGYLKIEDFTKTTPAEVESALKYFQKEKIKDIIIDVRDNPGGYLDALEEIADLFMPANKVVLKAKDVKGKVVEYKTRDNDYYKGNYVLLTNKNSASASEAFVSSLNENMDIPIMGETTFGKGIMQSFKEYSDGSYLKFTSAEWLTPNDNHINKKGVKPTKEVKDSAIYAAKAYPFSLEKDIKFDTVSTNLISYQKTLKALGYNIDRVDGYYSSKTAQAVNKFKKDNGLGSEKDLSLKVQDKVIEKLFIEWSKQSNDYVLKEALK